MTASQIVTQRQIMAKDVSEEAMASPFMKQQKMMLYGLPVVFGVGGIVFPIGVLIYWTTTNVWTMGQQFFVIDRRAPGPGGVTPDFLRCVEEAQVSLATLSRGADFRADPGDAEADFRCRTLRRRLKVCAT